MSSTLLTPSIIAKEALMQLENNLVIGNLVHRAYEAEYGTTSEGSKKGATITIRKPVRYVVRDGAIASMQDTTEGSTTIVVNKQKGVDLQFSSSDMTLKITDFSERYIKPAMSQLANQVDSDLYALYTNVANWVGTPGQTVNSITDFNLAAQRLDEMAVPTEERRAILTPADYYGMVGSMTSLYAKQGATAETALRRAELGTLSNIDTYMAQNVATFTRGTATNSSPTVNGNAATTYTSGSVATTNQQTLNIQAGVSAGTYMAGDIITINGVYAVNPVSKTRLPYLKQFAVVSNVTASGGAAALTITPAVLNSSTDPYQNCVFDSTINGTTNGQAVVLLGTASTGYSQNLVFHKNALALCMVPMEMPDGAVKKARESYKGLSVRLVGQYDITNDINLWRLDLLYGVKAIYPELATRLSGTA